MRPPHRLLVLAASAASALVPAAAAAGAAPPAFTLARQLGSTAAGIRAVSAGDRVGVTVTLLAVDGSRPLGRHVRVTLRGTGGSAAAAASACGAGCYRAAVPRRGRPLAATVTVDGRSAVYPFPPQWPPRPAAAAVAAAGRAVAAARTTVYEESLTAGLGPYVLTRFEEQAPDRLRYRIHGSGYAEIVIGTRRWTRAAPGAPWRSGPGLPQPLDLPAPAWSGRVRDAVLLGPGSVEGARTLRASFVTVPYGEPIWYEVDLDPRTRLPLRVRMVTTAHFMVDRTVRWNGPLLIVPPR